MYEQNRVTNMGISSITVKIRYKVFQQSILQRLMESLAHSTIVLINRISELLQLDLQKNSNSLQKRAFSSKQKRFVTKNQLFQEINSLESSIRRILEKGQSLQNENRVLKRMITRQNSAYLTESNKLNSWNENCLLNKYLSKVTYSNYSNGTQMMDSQIDCTQSNIFATLSQLEKIKVEVLGLTENLKSITKAYEKYELDSTNDHEIKDIFLNESSLMRFGLNKVDENDELTTQNKIELEHLLCDEELSFDDLPLQEMSLQKSSNQPNMVESLIAKGIEFRESRTLRSKQYQTLSSRIQQYREQIGKKDQFKDSQTQSISKYR